MRNRVPAVVLAVALVSVLALLAVPAAASGGSGSKVTRLAATLSGANEVPGPGDPDGRGLGLVRTGKQRVCFALGWTGIAPPIFAHIHVGAAGVAGPVVVLFFDVPELTGAPTATLPATVAAAGGCVDGQDPALLRNIRRDPASYYVNIHTLEFVPGAIRGQLRRVA
ncbi:MAG TPA: CHRD domain-containing protein [Actinomycetes bacterium]|nr:CHRD domain-containing protein [Actinomycetes bacterium]